MWNKTLVSCNLSSAFPLQGICCPFHTLGLGCQFLEKPKFLPTPGPLHCTALCLECSFLGFHMLCPHLQASECVTQRGLGKDIA